MFSAVSYVLHFMLLRGKIVKFFRDAEIKFALFLIAFCTLFAGIGACYAYSKANAVAFGTNWLSLFGDSLFYVVTSAATTGFSSLDSASFLALGKPIIFVCVLLMLIGGGMGSAGGGIKQYRIILCLKDLMRNVKYRFSSNRTLNPTTIYRYGERRQIEESKFKEAHNYAVLYLIVFLASSALLCVLPEIDPEEALFDVSSGMSNTGLALIDYVSYGKAHPHAYPVLLWILSIGMLLGRLEIMPLIDTFRNYILEFKAINSEKRRKKEKDQSI